MFRLEQYLKLPRVKIQNLSISIVIPVEVRDVTEP